MEHKSLHDAVVIEIFAGNGGITAWIRKVGMHSSFGIDCAKYKFPKAPIIILDLLTHEGERLLWHYLSNENVIGVWMAPPCGTASKAREIQNGGPPPLRSDTCPDGLINLSAADNTRVNKANALYWLTNRVALFCATHGLFFFIENPFSSVFWKTSAMHSLLNSIYIYFQAHVACAYGSKRPKKTMLASNIPEVEMICHGCPGNHKHLQWGQIRVKGNLVFATAEEKHYPPGLCAFVAQIILQVCETYKLTLPMDSLATLRADLSTLLNFARAQTVQFTRSKLPQLIPEYKTVLRLVHTAPTINVNHHLLLDSSYNTATGNTVHIPAYAKSLTKLPLQEGGKDEKGNFNFFRCAWGLQWNEAEFVEQAMRLGHPKSFLKALPKELETVVQTLVHNSLHEIAGNRTSWIKRWTKRAEELSKREAELHKSMDEHTQAVVRGKRILLLEEMLNDAGYYDLDVVGILKTGVPMVGPVKEAGHFAKTFKPALISVECLGEKSEQINAAVLQSCKGSGDDACDRHVYDETLKERDRGWLQGPLSVDELPAGASIGVAFCAVFEFQKSSHLQPLEWPQVAALLSGRKWPPSTRGRGI